MMPYKGMAFFSKMETFHDSLWGILKACEKPHDNMRFPAVYRVPHKLPAFSKNITTVQLSRLPQWGSKNADILTLWDRIHCQNFQCGHTVPKIIWISAEKPNLSRLVLLNINWQPNIYRYLCTNRSRLGFYAEIRLFWDSAGIIITNSCLNSVTQENQCECRLSL